jgi:hypothetical protein
MLSDFVTAKKMHLTIFCDRTNVRSKLFLLGHLSNLVGHCPMSNSCKGKNLSTVKPTKLYDSVFKENAPLPKFDNSVFKENISPLA